MFIFGKCTMCTGKKHIFCNRVHCSTFYVSGQFGSFVRIFYISVFFLSTHLKLTGKDMLKFLVRLSISSCSSVNFYFMYFEAMLLGIYPLKRSIYSWWIDHFIISKCHSYSSCLKISWPYWLPFVYS